MEPVDRSPGLCISHSERSEIYLQDSWRRDVYQPEIEVHHPGHSVHGVSESDGAWWRRFRPEEAGNLWSKLSVSRVCENRGDHRVILWHSRNDL